VESIIQLTGAAGGYLAERLARHGSTATGGAGGATLPCASPLRQGVDSRSI
jgi:hypothetical protein